MNKSNKNSAFPNFPLAELHAHLGTSISPATLWQIAHDQGIKLPKRDFTEFREHITLSRERKSTLEDYFDNVYHKILDPLSSGILAVEKATYNAMAGAYRESGISTIELRNNPMKHNGKSQFDLDHIILAMLRGMERALLEHDKLNAGLILCMAREFTARQNEIIVEKAIKYRSRGIVAIDVAGPGNDEFDMKDYEEVFKKAKDAGLGVTVHSGEQPDTDDMWGALEYAQPSRIGHGISAAYDKELMKVISERNIVLEVCPLSNIATKAVENLDEMKFIIRTLLENNVKFCINTDWPEVIEDAHLQSQFKLLLDEDILSEEELKRCNQIAHEASFIPKPGGLEAYLA